MFPISGAFCPPDYLTRKLCFAQQSFCFYQTSPQRPKSSTWTGHCGLDQLTSLISHFSSRSKVGGLKYSRVGRVPGAFLLDTQFWMALSFSVVVFPSGNGLERWWQHQPGRALLCTRLRVRHWGAQGICLTGNRSPGLVLSFYWKKQRSKATFQSHTANEKRGIDLCLGFSPDATIKHPDQDNF